MTQISKLQRVLRLPSIPTLALYAATLVTEVPVIFTRMLITFAVAAIVLLIKGESPGGAQGLAELMPFANLRDGDWRRRAHRIGNATSVTWRQPVGVEPKRRSAREPGPVIPSASSPRKQRDAATGRPAIPLAESEGEGHRCRPGSYPARYDLGNPAS
jgi:hypothetical protein